MQAFHLLRQGAIILTAVLLAKSSLSTTEIGGYEQLLYINYAITFFWVSGLIQGLLTKYPDADAADRGAYLFNSFLLFFGVSLLFYVLLRVFAGPALQFFTGKPELDYYYIFLLYLLFNLPTYLVENYYLLLNRPHWIFYFGLFSFLGHLLVVLVPVFANWGFVYSFYGLVGLALCKFIWLLRLVQQRGRREWRPDLLRGWLWLAAPLMGYAFIGGMLQTFDNWLVNYWYDGDEEKFAIFRYGARELPLALALASAFSSAMLPEVRKDLETALRAIRQKSLRLFHLLFPVSVVLLLSSDWLFPVVFNEAFEESIPIFDTFLLILSSRLIFSRTVLVGLQDNRMVLGISFLELLINIGSSLLLIRYLGLPGVAVGSIIAYSAEKALICLYLWRKYAIAVPRYTHLGWWGGYTGALLLIYLLKYLT